MSPRPAPKHDPDSELKKIVLKPAIPVTTTEKPKENQMDMPKFAEPTTEQRLKIRQLLDEHFDDQNGSWLDGYSDERIATDVNLPRLVISKIREAGWGPEKIDPEITLLRAEFRAISERLRDAEKRLAKIGVPNA